MNSVVHFEIPADDLARAKKFYGDSFGWQLQDMPEMDYVMVTTTEMGEDHIPKNPGAINGGITDRSGFVKQPSLAIDVDDIDAAMEKVISAGGKMAKEKMSVGPMGFVAYFTDTEGNLISLFQAAK